MFRATHIFGPMAGDANDTMVASATLPKRVWYAPAPEGVHVFPNGYMMVGVHIPPEVPWPGQVEYVLDEGRSSAFFERGAAQGVAVYVLVDD